VDLEHSPLTLTYISAHPDESRDPSRVQWFRSDQTVHSAWVPTFVGMSGILGRTNLAGECSSLVGSEAYPPIESLDRSRAAASSASPSAVTSPRLKALLMPMATRAWLGLPLRFQIGAATTVTPEI
jgi:hypothetical protein